MKAVLKAACKNVKATATACRVPYQRMADALNVHEPQPFHADWLPTFLEENGDDALRWLCQTRGGMFDRLPDVTSHGFASDCEELRRRFMRLVQEVGRDSAAIERALADMELTDSEGRDLVAELENTVQVQREAIAVALLIRGKRAAARMTLPVPTAERRRA